MVEARSYNLPKYIGRSIILHMKNGNVDRGKFLSYDSIFDNDIGDGFVLDVNGDDSIGRLVLEKNVERVEFED